MSSSLRLALLTLNLTQNDFNRMDRDNFKKYIENLFKQDYVKQDFEKYKLAARIALENKPKEENINNNVVCVEEENSSRRRNENNHSINNSLMNQFYHPFAMFSNNFSNMMNEIDNLHRNLGNFNIQDNFSNLNMVNSSSTNMMNNYDGTNGVSKSFSRTYVNNNGTGYIKEESIENDGKGAPKVKTIYKKIDNGKYVEEPSKTSQKLITQ